MGHATGDELAGFYGGRVFHDTGVTPERVCRKHRRVVSGVRCRLPAINH
jgi:hypothetical protein